MSKKKRYFAFVFLFFLKKFLNFPISSLRLLYFYFFVLLLILFFHFMNGNGKKKVGMFLLWENMFVCVCEVDTFYGDCRFVL